jgi:peptidyl-prolyl cis-trans isomerase D
VVAILKNTTEKGQLPLDKIKDKIEPSVKNYKKIEMTADKMSKAFKTTKDLNGLASQLNAKIDTVDIKFSGYGRTALANEGEIVGQLFTVKKGEVVGPFTGLYGAYFVDLVEVTEPAPKEDFTSERMQIMNVFSSRVSNSAYQAIEKAMKIEDNRVKFF